MNKIYKIYKVTNLVNNKCYIGQTSMDIEKRWYCHVNNSNCLALLSAIEKYGQENFKIDWIASSWNKYLVTELESYFIEFYNTKTPNGYNIKDASFIGNFSGTTIERMSKSQKERAKKMTKEEKDNTYRGIYNYVENKKRPIIGMNFEHETIEFPTLTASYEQGFFPEASLKDKYTRSKGYIFFYKDEYTIDQMINIIELAKTIKLERLSQRKEKVSKSLLEYSKYNSKHITAVNPITRDIKTYKNKREAILQGVASSAIIGSLKGKLLRYKGYHFFYTAKHTIEEMFKISEERNELIQKQFLEGRKKAQVNNQKNIDKQKVPIIGINPKTLEYKVFESISNAKNQGYSMGGIGPALRGQKRTSKGMHFQYYTKSIEEHIEIVKALYS